MLFRLYLVLGVMFLGSLPGLGQAGDGTLPTLAESDTEAIDRALDGKQPGPETQNVYTGQDAAVTHMGYNIFARNKNLWIGPAVDLTAIGAYNTGSESYGTKFEITAISPLHCLGAAHCASAIGAVFNFVGSDNKTYTRTVVGRLNPVDDVEVYLLSQELPPSVTPMHILPRDWSSYLRPGVPLGMPAIFISQRNQLYCAEAYGITLGPNPQVIYRMPTTRQRLAFNTQIISGDSSFPELVLVNGTPAILSTWHYGGYGAGPLDAAHFDVINKAMRQLTRQVGLESNYQLSPVNMAGIAKLR